jgi:hypothetical protein
MPSIPDPFLKLSHMLIQEIDCSAAPRLKPVQFTLRGIQKSEMEKFESSESEII